MSVTSLPLTLTGIPDNLCFEGTYAEALIASLALVRVLVPSSISNVVVGATSPTDSQRDFVWFRQNNAGDFIGIFIYAGGDWQQITPVPNGLPWIFGDSANPPAGYISADDVNSPLTAPEKAHLITLWYPPGPGPYTIYQGVYVGF